MPSAYSEDLRDKVMMAIAQGEKKSHISQIFNISCDTIDRWLKRRAVTGSVQAVQGYQSGHSHRSRDWDELRAFTKISGDKTQAEMAQLWQDDISEPTIVLCSSAHRHESKKKTYGYRERDAAKRAAFVAQLVTLSP